VTFKDFETNGDYVLTYRWLVDFYKWGSVFTAWYELNL